MTPCHSWRLGAAHGHLGRRWLNYYAKVHVRGSTHLVRESLNRFEERLDPRYFARIHRSTIVNLDRVKELRPWFHGAYLVIIEDGTELRMSRGQRMKLWDRLNRT